MRLVSDDSLAIMTIWQEARGEPHPGRIAVAEVILNRMKHKYSSDGTVAGTVLKPYQFSGYNTKDPNRIPSFMLDDSSPIVVACSNAWATAKAGSTFAEGALLYFAPSVVSPPEWVASCSLVATIGRHLFYLPNP